MDAPQSGIELSRVSPGTQIILGNEPVPPHVLSDLTARGYNFRTLAAPRNQEELRDLCFPSPQPTVE
jgi:hypothetical protein